MKNLTVGTKLYIAFGIIILLTIVTGGASIQRFTTITNVFIELQTDYAKIVDDSMEIQIRLLTARRHEKDFLVRKDPKYLDRMNATLDEFQKLTNDMAEVATHLGLNDVVSVSAKVSEDKEIYQKAFDNVAGYVGEQGDSTSGIRGELRKHAHNMEEAIVKSKSSALMIDYLLLRRHEKDYILREDHKYVLKAQDVLKDMDTKHGQGINPDDHKAVISHAELYLKTLELFEQNITAIQEQYPLMRSSAHDIETLLESLETSVVAIMDAKQTDTISKESSTILFLYIFYGAIVLTGILLSLFSDGLDRTSSRDNSSTRF